MANHTYEEVCEELRDYREGEQIFSIINRLIPVGTETGFLHRMLQDPNHVEFEAVMFDEETFIHVKGIWFSSLHDLEQSSVKIEVHPMRNRRFISADFFDHGMTTGGTKFRDIIYKVLFEDGHIIDITRQNGFKQSNDVYESTIKRLIFS